MNNDIKLLFFDTETTGLYPNKYDIVQIAGIIVINNEVKEEFNFKMHPKSENPEIMPEALEVIYGLERGFLKANKEEIKVYSDRLRSRPDPSNQFNKILAIFDRHINKYDKNDKFIPAGQNIMFDLQFFRKFFYKNKNKFFGSYVTWCPNIEIMTLTSLLKVKGLIDIDNIKLGTIAAALGIEFNAHDALEDIKATYQIYQKFIDLLPNGQYISTNSIITEKQNERKFLDGIKFN